MKAKFLTAAPLLALSVLTSQAQAVDTTLTLSGQIMPVACTMTVSNNGIYDYGDIPFSSLRTNAATSQPTLTNEMSIQCSGPTLIALKSVDNREGTAIYIGDYGLGTDTAGNKIGSYYYSMSSVTLGGNPGRLAISNNGGTTWHVFDIHSLSKAPGMRHSFTDMTATAPIAVTNATVQLSAKPSIAASDSLDPTGAIILDGYATVELLYL